MCGIAGGLFWGGAVSPDRAAASVRTMVAALAHRGPDGSGVSSTTGAGGDRQPLCVLGHTRLAIIDVSPLGAQPMSASDGLVQTTFNGEIYNFAQLRGELESLGHAFRSHSDTEVILRGYQQWGMDVVPKLRGMFALAIWDQRTHQLLLVRDRLGIKPLYLHQGDGFLLFASEVRALLATGLVPRRLDAVALDQYLAYQTVPAPRTLIAGVRMMDPASWTIVSGTGSQRSGTYWRMLDAGGRPRQAGAGEARELVLSSLREAVSTHLVSDVPVGAFLSGGIDSSAVVALMRQTNVTPRTFSVGFEEDAFDESRHASLVARTFDTEHMHIQLTGSELLDRLPGALAAMDQPSGDAVNTYVVSAAVRETGIKVALSGLGGDEVFGGYPSFARLPRIAAWARAWGVVPQGLRRIAAAGLRFASGQSIQGTKAAALLESDGSIAAMFPTMREVFSPSQRAGLLSPDVARAAAGEPDPYRDVLSQAFRQAPTASLFARISFAEARTYMHDLLLRDTDQMSMAHGLEARVPLLDHELIDLVMSLPDTLKHPAATPKPLLVEALGPLLPASIVNRPKQGFTLPFDVWMRGPLNRFCEERLQALSERGLMSGPAIAASWRAFNERERSVSWSRLWTLVVLGTWLDRHEASL